MSTRLEGDRDAWVKSLLLGFEPRCSRHLGLSCNILVHLYANSRLVWRRYVAVDDNFAFFDPVLPKIRMIDPMPLARQEVWIGRASVRRRHHSNRRDDTVWCYWDVVSLRHVSNLLGFRQATNLLEVRLNDIDRFHREQLCISPAHIDVFAASDRRR